MKKNSRYTVGFLFPMVLIMVSLVLIPIVKTFFYSLQKYKLTEPQNTRYIGLDNYIEILKGSPFWYSVGNTALIIVVVILAGLVLSIWVALILNRDTRISGFLTAVAIIPWALPPVVNGMIWKFIFHPDHGLMNRMLLLTGVVEEPVKWLNSRVGSLIIVGLIVAWRVIPFCAIVFLANMQAISKEIFEAAKVDGAGELSTFTQITMPLLLPSVAIVLTNLTMQAINVFDEVIALVGYRSAGQPLLIYNYTETFSFLNFGYGSAITYIIMLGSGVFGYLYIRSLKGRRDPA